MKKIPLLALLLTCLTLLMSCAQHPLKGESFQEVIIRNASPNVLVDVRLFSPDGDTTTSIQTNAIYPFSQFALGFSPQKAKGKGLMLSWKESGTSYSKDLAPHLQPIKDKHDVYAFVVIVTGNGDIQTTVEAVR